MDIENFYSDLLEPFHTIKNGSNSSRNYLMTSPEFVGSFMKMREEYGHEAFNEYITLAQETLDKLKQITLKHKFMEHIKEHE